MNDEVRRFFYWIDKMSEAEQKRDLKQMKKCLKKAEEIPVVNEFQRWVRDYSKAVFQLLYGDETERDAACGLLLTLHDQAVDSPDLYEFVHELYVKLLIHVLQKNYVDMERFPRYGELAGELIEIVEEEEKNEVDCQDLYSFSHSVLGMYYGKTGRVVLGERCYRKVWNRVRTDGHMSGYAFCGLVYLAYDLIFLGNVQEANEICTYLWEKLSGGCAVSLFQPDINRFMGTFCYCLQCMGEDEKALGILEAGFDRRLLHASGLGDHMELVYGSYLYELLRYHKTCPAHRRKEIEKYLKNCEKNRSFKQLTAWQRANFYRVRYYMDKICGGKNADRYLEQCRQILMTEPFDEVDRIPFLNSMLHVIQEYRNTEQGEKLVSCVDALMKKTLAYYSDAEFFLDNQKMERYLEICRYSFEFAYAKIRDFVSPEKLFEYVMNEKNVLLSAIRYRNRLNETERIRRKEPQRIFTFYRPDQLQSLIPPETAVVECFWPDGADDLDIFVAANEQTGTRFMYHRIRDDSKLRRQLKDWTECMHSYKGKNEKRSTELYNKILAPAEGLLCHKKHIWICPHQELCNISFEVLLKLAGQDWEYEDMVYWQSLRDMFEEREDGMGNAAGNVPEDLGEERPLIAIGDPLFYMGGEASMGSEAFAGDKASGSGEASGSSEASSQGSSELHAVLEQMKPLPFSAYEAGKVAQLTGGICCLKEQATKYSLKSGYLYLHIATHGIFHQAVRNPWYQSRLAFSGAADHIVSGKTCAGYGDGFLSAEEISRMNLSGTEMVVLSACNSGNSHFTDFRQQTGIHVAFGAAGVRYVISALWEVDDFATSVFMNFFYQNIRGKVCVPQALALARERLKRVTVKELLEILEADRDLLDSRFERVTEELRELPEEYCIYHSPAYWGGFVCYQY